MLGKILLLEASRAAEERSRVGLLEHARRSYEESLHVARSQSDLMSVLHAVAGLLDAAVESGDEQRVRRECDRFHDIANTEGTSDVSGLGYAREKLARSVEQAQVRFPMVADRLKECMSFLAEGDS